MDPAANSIDDKQNVSCEGSGCAVLVHPSSEAEQPGRRGQDQPTSGIITKSGIKARRIESPSSINTFKQCPRKYFYQYIMKYPTAFNIHTVLGGVCHSVLEIFFDQDVRSYTDLDFAAAFQGKIQELLMSEWSGAKPKLAQLGITHDQERFYFEEAALMLLNWGDKFSAKIRAYPGGFQEAYAALTPTREKEYKSMSMSVRGFIDVIEKTGPNVRLMDYKTSKRFEMNHEYKLQLSIYALMYQEEHGQLPTHVGLYFLKDPYQFEYVLPVDQDLLDHARVEIDVMHMNTQSNNIVDYPKKVTALCKWSTGQCDFYGRCFNKECQGN
ncbi:MAG: PD-(D/E)XK nuclease family protein [Nanoarchaeota archaeon]